MRKTPEKDTYFVHLSGSVKAEINRLKRDYGYPSQAALILDCVRCLEAVLTGKSPPKLPVKQRSDQNREPGEV